MDEAIEIMEDAKVKRLIVMNEEDRMVGILAMSDIAQNGPGHEVTGEAVEAILSP